MNHRFLTTLCVLPSILGCVNETSTHEGIGSRVASRAMVVDPPDLPSPPHGGWARTAMLYFPNRFMDLFDVARAGVEAGPGIGIDVMATDHLRFGAMNRWSLGLGLQTLRHPPYKEGSEEYVEFGPAAWIRDIAGTPWRMDPFDVRVEFHAAIVGAHIAVNPAEILDFFAGFALFDFRDDDMR